MSLNVAVANGNIAWITSSGVCLISSKIYGLRFCCMRSFQYAIFYNTIFRTDIF